jgi:hypothetical protein
LLPAYQGFERASLTFYNSMSDSDTAPCVAKSVTDELLPQRCVIWRGPTLASLWILQLPAALEVLRICYEAPAELKY